MTRPHRATIAGLIAVAIALTSACAAPEPAHPNASVKIDMLSGSGKPSTALDSKTTDALVAYLDVRGKFAEPAVGQYLPTGFRGLIVTPDATASEPTAIRVLPRVVYVTDSIGTVRIPDIAGTAFGLVWDSARSGFDANVVEAVDAAQAAS